MGGREQKKRQRKVQLKVISLKQRGRQRGTVSEKKCEPQRERERNGGTDRNRNWKQRKRVRCVRCENSAVLFLNDVKTSYSKRRHPSFRGKK